MSEYKIDLNQIITEGDVELKVIIPLLTNEEPIGLGYDKTNIQTKQSLKKILIDKGNKSQLYYPDFVISINGIPLFVVEAKKPNEDLFEAFRQASLYAGELNRYFPTDINPCELIIATDGLRILAGSWETATPHFDLSSDDWIVSNNGFSAFLQIFSFSEIDRKSITFRKALNTKANYTNPLYQLGGKLIQDQTNSNTFGETISIGYQHLFNPLEESERIDIVRNAYVKVTKHMSHVDPIDRLIRKKIRPAIEQSKEILDNANPKELLLKLEKAHEYNNQVILLIGSVGSGKSTFTTYLKETALNKKLLSNLSWIKIDLNDIEVSREEIYKSIKTNIIGQIQQQYTEIDFDNIDFINKLYQKEIGSLKKGVLQLLTEGSEKYNSILVDKILEFQSDIDLTLNCYIRELVHGRHKNLIIVLDNCDKRTLEEQLLMFEVANWIKDKVKAIVFLPLRDTTFDHFRNEKPLDTVIKDLIFRINPPSLEKVIYERIKYANRLSESSTENFYHLPNGWRVRYPSSDELFYLKSILSSLFQNRYFKKLITGLAGRDVRKGIEIFLDFCKSGHISDRDIFKMKQLKGEFILPNHIISRVILRGNRLYYSDSESRIKNLFQSDPSDDLPDPFIRIAILKWLHENRRKNGPSGIVGFHKAEDLISAISKYGHSKERIESELTILLKNALIISESQEISMLNIEDLISINPPGVIHYELLNNIDYLSSVAENVWYSNEDISSLIRKNMAGRGRFSHLSIENNIEHSKLIIDYLKNIYEVKFSFREQYLTDNESIQPLNFESLKESIVQFKTKINGNEHAELEVGSKFKGKIVNIQNYGIFCEIVGTEKAGLIHVTDLDEDFDEVYNLGDVIDIEIKGYRQEHNKYNLKLCE